MKIKRFHFSFYVHMDFAQLCSSRGLTVPNGLNAVPQLAQLVLYDERYTIPVFAAYSAYALPIVSHWIEHDFDKIFVVLDRVSLLVPLLPYLPTIAEHFVAMHAEKWSSSAESLPALIRLLVHDFRRYAPYFSAEQLRAQASNSTTTEHRALALVALGLLMQRSESLINDWLAKYIQSDALQQFEFQNILRRSLADAEDRCILSTPGRNTLSSTINDSQLVTELGGIFVPRLGGSDQGNPRFVETETFAENVRTFAEKLLTDQPLLLVGERGSGKTSVVEMVHERVRTTELVRIHLGEQTDAKALVGNYTTGALPGTFEWTPGVLTSAVQRGQWVLIEDIDRAPNEIVAVLLSLLTHRELVIPSRNQVVRAAPGFRIVATTATDSVDIIGQRTFAQVPILAPTNADLATIVCAKRPFLTPLVADMFVTVFRRVEDHENQKSTREASTRDLIRLVHRVGPQYTAEDMFREAVTCFTSYLADPWPLARVIGEAMNIAESQVMPLLTRHTPELAATDSEVIIGRAHLERRPVTSSAARNIDAELSSTKFALTQPTLKLMEEIAVGIQHIEPVLLVGETGTGKTTVVQHIAKMARRKLVVINVSQQVETGDLVGGYKPVDARQLAGPLLDEFYELFDMTFSRAKNHQFLTVLDKTVSRNQWKNVVKLLREAVKMATNSGEAKRMRRDTGDWSNFPQQISAFEQKLDTVQQAAQFQFIEGLLVRALRQGHWVLLDELNLAPADTIEGISELLSSRSLTMLENAGEVVHAHPQFRLFANMNPATDVGKRDLPMSVRTQFTEVWSPSPDSDIEALRSIVARYLPPGTDTRLVNDIAQLYTAARDMAAAHQLVDGAGQRPHFSIRTLSRMLVSGTAIAQTYGLRRALFETFIMSFLTLLDDGSSQLLGAQGEKWLLEPLPNRKSAMSVVPPAPGPNYVQFQHWWMPLATDQVPNEDAEYILTPSVERNLLNLVRATAPKSYPVLIQGPTSSGKTSMITYLAKRTGHTVVRINNHEHTDLAEYMGGYESDSNGTLVFREGALVTALRNGHWLVLDELNLAPTDVLEALNRLLDDNRELLVPETQEIIKPHPDFVLFATQNPPGIYAGRKVLSRAFRNRFLELHFDEIPEQELEQIVRDRTGIAPSYAAKIVEVYRELARQRIQRVFEQAATLRDLFRWAKRPAIGYEELAFNGYCLLAERSRTSLERDAVKSVIEKVMRVQVQTDIASLANPQVMAAAPPNIVWTRAMRRVLALVQMAITQNEPVLLIGETGCGKTTIIQALAAAQQQGLLILNAHQNTETGDLVGSQRPVRSHSSKLFEWVDGPLVVALKNGQFFLLDEISLADDSVLERLNSVLEPERTLFVPEIGSIQAAPTFQFFSTMNPGGDYGKKELSPALRNRFTEIWVPTVDDVDDLKMIVSQKLKAEENELGTSVIVEFSQWFSKEFHMVSLRDILSWAEFVNSLVGSMNYTSILVHGAFLTFIDGLGMHVIGDSVGRLRRKCISKLESLVGTVAVQNIDDTELHKTDTSVSVGEFSLTLQPDAPETLSSEFSFSAPTSALNAKRVVRAMQVKKPVLLEGSPGAGKTSLISALARLSGAKLTRINLSDQTDLSDLFGQDVPLEEPGKFGWRTAPFLRSMQQGEWVLLDEMNLAPQPVLEGLNACLDHRGEAYIPELDRTFSKSPNFTVFAAQNPQGQGGGRKGLPKSFVNRFSVVYVDQLGLRDLHAIAATTHSSVDKEVREKLATFVEELAKWSSRQLLSGGPFEFNLRDTLRWLDLVASTGQPAQDFLPLVVTQRLRSSGDKLAVEQIFQKFFQPMPTNDFNPLNISPAKAQIGSVEHIRGNSLLVHANTNIPANQIRILETGLQCVLQSWPLIVVGASGSGKSSFIQVLAQLCGANLREFAMTPDIDSTDLLGEFDQLEMESERQQMWFSIEEEVSRNIHSVEDARLVDAVKSRDLNLVKQMLGANHEQSLQAILRFEATDFSKPLFKWVDGMLVRAVEQGDWLVLDNANLCSAAVLDRLNSLLERGGSLAVNECANADGSPREIRPHANFRLFLTVNPKYGELSRAMRNRGVEIFLDEQCSFKGDSISSRELPSQFLQPLTISRLNDLQTRTWLRALAVGHRTPLEFTREIDEELCLFASSPYFSKDSFESLQANWLKFLLAQVVDKAMHDARASTSKVSSLLVISALRRIRDSVECEFDLYGLLEFADQMVADTDLFTVLLDLSQVNDPSRVPVYRDWLLKFCDDHSYSDFAAMVRQSLGRQYDFKDGGAGMEIIWQQFGRPVGFPTETAHDDYVGITTAAAEFDELVTDLGLEFTEAIAQIRLVLSQAASVDETIMIAIKSFRESLTGVSRKPIHLTDQFLSLWESLALVYTASPSSELFTGIAELTNLAKLRTQDLRSLVKQSGLSIPNIVVPPPLESVIISVLQNTQQGQAIPELKKITSIIIEFGREFTEGMQSSNLVEAIGRQLQNDLAQISSIKSDSILDLAKHLLHLYVCPLPLDPAIAQHVWYHRYIAQQQEFRSDEKCWQEMQELLGSDSSELTDWLRSRVINEQPIPSIWRPEESGISLVHRDMLAVAQLVVNVASRENLSEEETALIRRNAEHLYGRLSRATGYRDLVFPVLAACSLLTLHLSNMERKRLSDVSNLWLLDPVATAAGKVETESIATSELPLLVLQNMLCFPELSVNLLDRVIRNVHQTWTMDRLKLEEKQREQASGVRYINAEGDDEEAQVEREFKQMFPDYDEVTEIPQHNDFFVPEFVKLYCQLLLGAKMSLGDTLLNAANQLTSAQGRSSAVHLPALILALNRRYQDRNMTSSSEINFYRDPSPVDSDLSVRFADFVTGRVHTMLELWPEHDTLQTIARVAREIIDLPPGAPVALHLSKLEQLHHNLYEWDRFASKEYKVGDVMAQATTLIVRWRQLELATWPALFLVEKKRAAEGAAPFWFHLYETLVFAPVEDLGNTAKVLVLFMSESSIGQYHSRLQLLLAFEAHLNLYKDDNHLAVQRCVKNVRQYFEQFSEQVQNRLDDLEKQLRKKVDEVVKLASWRDVNIHALKQSAQRSHRQLFKFVRKFRDLLQTPAPTSDAVVQTDANFPKIQTSPQVDWVALTASVSAQNFWSARPVLLRDLGPLRTSLERYASQCSISNVTSLYGIACDIEQRAAKLRKETPSKWTKENKKEISALKMEKQQLLTSTLRELHSSGLKISVNKTTIESQAELTRVLSLAPNLENTIFSTSDAQFYAWIELLPKLRAAVSDAASSESVDVPIQDLQRGLALTEDLFSHTLRLRKYAFDHAFVDSYPSESLGELAQNPVDSSFISQSNVLLRTGHMIDNLSDFIEEVLIATRGPSGITSEIRKQAQNGLVAKNLTTRTDFTSKWLSNMKNSVADLDTKLSSTKVGAMLHATIISLQSELSSVHVNAIEKVVDYQRADAAVISASKSVLVVVQEVVKINETAEALEINEEDDDSNWLMSAIKQGTRMLATLRSQEISGRFSAAAELIFALSRTDPTAAAGLAAALMVFVQGYRRMTEVIENTFLHLLTSTIHGSLKLSKLLYSLATSGFCSPQPTDDDDDDQPEKGDGLGLGDGQGGQSSNQDVDEDEDDVTEAMQSANPEQEEREDDGEEDKAKEMEGDMAGELEDAPPNNEDEEEDEEGDDEDLDDEVGNLDDLDPNAVDDKMWDDQKPETEEKEKQTDENLDGSKNPDDDAEAGNDDQNQQQQQQSEDAGENGDENSEGEQEEEDAQDDQLGGEKEDEKVDEGTEQKDALDLPEDMQLDGDDNDEGADEDDGMNDDMDDEEEEEEEQGSGAPIDGEEEDAQQEEGEENMDVEEQEREAEEEHEDRDGDEAQPHEVPSEEEDAAEDSKPEDMNMEGADEEAVEGDSQGANIEGLHGPSDQQDQQPDQDQATSTENKTDSRGQGASEDASAEQSNLGMGGSSGANQDKPDDDMKDEMPDQQDQQASEQIKQSLKQLGDAMQQFHRRQQDIREHEDRENEEDQGKSSDPDRPLDGNEELEHVGAEDAFDTQALGKSEEHAKQEMDQSMAIDDDAENVEADEVAGDDETGAEHGGAAGETAAGEEESDSELPDEAPLVSANPGRDIEDVDEDEEESTREPVVSSENVEQVSRDDLWQVYESKTHDLALMLGEQLRLILEPTVASKLRGDYRTGKRLNMKRIIPYIASEFRKDKIWLRRTKPAKREYQILLALDDSKSMAEPAVVDLAFQAIALVGKALSSIEAGQVGIAKFGSTTEFVHSLDQPLTTQNGNAVLQKFHFNQQRTDVRQLLSKSLQMFAEYGSSNSEQWKLEIIVSDGIADDHQTLRKLVRQAYDERVMVVFVVLDALNKDTSVLDMNEVRYTTDDSGNPKLEVVKYFEDFPFDYYVIVRNIGDLPMVLANVLRQYFQAQQ